jgi:MFS transporter, DHA3 family, macrolide efflux protein
VAVLAFLHRERLWQLYLMNMLVSAGFWMFWPTITALIKELTPEGEFIQTNTFLLAGIQGGWLMAGAVVGFVYNHIGLCGVLLIDVYTYVISFLCYFAVRRGKHVVPRPDELKSDLVAAEAAEHRFWGELFDGLQFVRERPNIILLGVSWSLFLGAMLTGVVVTPSLSDRVFHAGPAGYGWLNGGWGLGAFLSAMYAPKVIEHLGWRLTIAVSMAVLASCMILSPFSGWLIMAVLLFGLMGSARGVSSVAMNTSLMDQVPNHLMGRVQNAFYFVGLVLQIALSVSVGFVAQYISLAGGFAIIGSVYILAFASAAWPAGHLGVKIAD